MTPRSRIMPRRRRWSVHRPPSGIALDMGSARTRVWTPEHGVVFDVPTLNPAGRGVRRPVRRGSVVDVGAAACFLDSLLGRQSAERRSLMVVATTPVVYGEADRSAVLAALEVLGPTTVLTIDSVKAAAIGADTDLGGPLLVVDIGAHLTEIGLLTDGAVSMGDVTALGTCDLRAEAPVAELVEAVAEAVVRLVRSECGPRVVDALDRGLLLTGGGALRADLADELAQRLGTTACPAPAPHLAAVRGAARALRSACRHPGFA